MYEMHNVKLWVNPIEIEESALKQIKLTSQHPELFKHVAIMPDVHTGIGCTIGSVIPLKNAVIPSAVGVDIGCGMCAVKSNIKLLEIEPHFEEIYHSILREIPVGFKRRQGSQIEKTEKWIEKFCKENEFEKYEKEFGGNIISQLGTLGGGNHFIELQVDNEDNIWVMLHSGSRNIGNLIATKYIKLAKEYGALSSEFPSIEGLEYFDANSPMGEEYLDKQFFAVKFASDNRFMMMHGIMNQLEHLFPNVKFNGIYTIAHNFVRREEHFGEWVYVHRKGATPAGNNKGIIPGSMGSKSYIVHGKSCADSFNSCSHGAGRTMSRSAASGKFNRRTKEYKSDGMLTVEDFEKDMQGIFSKSIDRRHLDESPRAYKDISKVMENQKDLVEIEVELTPVLNIKG